MSWRYTEGGYFKVFLKLQGLIQEGKMTLDDLAVLVPGVLHLNCRKDFSFHYVSLQGCEILGYSNRELKEKGCELLNKHQSPFTRELTHSRILEKLNHGEPGKSVIYYQDWRTKGNPPFFFLTTTQVFNSKHFLSVSFFPVHMEHLTQKVNRIFGINTVFQKYFEGYNRLTKREKEILELLGQDFTRCEIARQLYVSQATIKKHCENIYRKLGTHKRTELEKIAVSFLKMEK